MKTNETVTAPPVASQPGNVSVRQLAKSLISTPATAKQEQTETAGTETAAATREVPPAKNGEETETAEDLSRTEAGTETTEGTEATETTAAEETAEGTETAGTETTEETPGEETTATLSEAATARLNADLAPLIEELQKAGAKGALQILQKRIPKLVDQRDTERNGRLQAVEQNAQLRQELTEARKPKEVRQDAGPTLQHPEVAKVMGELNNVDTWLGWCEQNPEGGELPDGKGKDGTVQLDASQVTTMRRELEKNRTELVARKVQTEATAKAEFRQQFETHHAAAVAQYPWLKNAQSPEHQEMQGILQVAPWFKQSPDYELAIGDFLAGKALRLAKAKTVNGLPPRKPAAAREPTRVMADPPTTGARRQEPGKAKKEEADSKFKSSGSTKDLAKRFSADRQASRSGG